MSYKRLIEALDAERPAHPETPYDIGYNNGLTMAMSIAMRINTNKSTRLKNCYSCKTRAARLDFEGDSFAIVCGECGCTTKFRKDFGECADDWNEGMIYAPKGKGKRDGNLCK